jgi:hypothetical protein
MQLRDCYQRRTWTLVSEGGAKVDAPVPKGQQSLAQHFSAGKRWNES